MRHFFLIGCLMGLLLVAAGCGRKSVPSVTTTVSETTHEREIPRVVDVSIPGYQLGVKTVIECDSTTNKPRPLSITKTTDDRRASLEVRVTDEAELIADCKEDSLTREIEVRDREITRLKQTEKTVEVPVYRTRQIDVVCRWVTVGVVVLLAGKIGLKYVKTINPFA